MVDVGIGVYISVSKPKTWSIRSSACFSETKRGFQKILSVDLETDALLLQIPASYGRRPNADERVHHPFYSAKAVNLHAHLGQCDWEGGGMRTFELFVLDCLIRNEPCVAPAPYVLLCRPPPTDVGFVLIWNPYCKAVKLYASLLREVEDVFLAIVDEPASTDWFVVTGGDVGLKAYLSTDVLLHYSD
jgi:hypothetical protein